MNPERLSPQASTVGAREGSGRVSGLGGTSEGRSTWEDSVDVVALSRAYGFDVTDYGRARGRGVLLSVGSGLLMAAMDLMPSLRWATDLSGGKPAEQTREWCTWLDRVVSHVVVVAWFTITDPAFLAVGLEAVDPDKLAWHAPGVDLRAGGRFEQLDALAYDVETRYAAVCPTLGAGEL